MIFEEKKINQEGGKLPQAIDNTSGASKSSLSATKECLVKDINNMSKDIAFLPKQTDKGSIAKNGSEGQTKSAEAAKPIKQTESAPPLIVNVIPLDVSQHVAQVSKTFEEPTSKGESIVKSHRSIAEAIVKDTANVLNKSAEVPTGVEPIEPAAPSLSNVTPGKKKGTQICCEGK